MRGKVLNKRIHIAAQKRVPATTNLGDTAGEQVAGVERNQVGIDRRIVSHPCNNADTKSKAHVGFYHIGICRSEYHLWH